MTSDPLSDILRLTEARSVMAGGFAIAGTWGFKFAPPGVIVFSAVAEGSCWLRLDGHKTPIHLQEGDVGLLDGRRGFRIGSSATAPTRELVPKDMGGRIEQVAPNPDCVVLIGRVSLHPASATLFHDALPPRIHVRAASPTATGLRWLVEQLLEEQRTRRPGTSVASERLAELLFIQILRAHLAGVSVTLPAGWLRATSDERIVRALGAIHAEPGRAWTLEALARSAAMSRTRFAVRFKSVAGTAPLAYLAAWRMRLAQKILREDDTSIAQLARSLGYGSESAFSNAFKRITGVPPRTYRMRGDGDQTRHPAPRVRATSSRAPSNR